MNIECQKEEWREVVGFEGLYWVSNIGRVKNKKGLILVIVRGKVKKKGYRYVNLSKNGKQKDFPIHRLVAKSFILNPDNLPTVNHKDLNKENNNVDNLEWMSFGDNTIHALKAKGLYKNTKQLALERALKFKQKRFYIYDYRNILIGVFDRMKEAAKFCNVSPVSGYEYLKTGKLSTFGFKISSIDIEPDYCI